VNSCVIVNGCVKMVVPGAVAVIELGPLHTAAYIEHVRVSPVHCDARWESYAAWKSPPS